MFSSMIVFFYIIIDYLPYGSRLSWANEVTSMYKQVNKFITLVHNACN